MPRPAIATQVVLAALLTAAGGYAQSTPASSGSAPGGSNLRENATPPVPAAASAPTPTVGIATPVTEERFRWRRSWFIWENAVTAQTLGIGKSYQSANPTYEMSLSLRPRYYLHDGEKDAVYVEGRIDLTRELTNSDVTTKEHETTFSDANVFAAYSRILADHGEFRTLGTVFAPSLVIPTSKFSRDNGTILGLGGGFRLNQSFPLLGDQAPVFRRFFLRGEADYNHTFTTAIVPTNADLRRVRLDPSGRTVPGDQLTGAAFPEHELQLSARGFLEVASRIALWSEFIYRPTWKYALSNECVATVTGCATPTHVDDPSRYVVLTSFQAEVLFDIIQEFGVSIGYQNVELQPGPDGLRRSVFYSPGAQFYIDVTAYLDEIYLTATGRRSEPPDRFHLVL